MSFSNPARQNLFTYEDAVGKRPKAEAAAARLGEIVPGLNVSGVQLEVSTVLSDRMDTQPCEVPMPGKSTTGGIDDISRAVEKLDSLIAGHDVVFLLTDSRESR